MINSQVCRMLFKNIIMSKDVRSTVKKTVAKLKTELHAWIYGRTNDILMIFLSTAQSQYSIKRLMIHHTPQLVKSRPSGLPQWQPIIDGSHRPVRHSHHVPTATIASSVALFNQSSQTEAARLLQTQPAVYWSASQRNQQSGRPSLNLPETISDFAWLCLTLCHYSTRGLNMRLVQGVEGITAHCYAVCLNRFRSKEQNRQSRKGVWVKGSELVWIHE